MAVEDKIWRIEICLAQLSKHAGVKVDTEYGAVQATSTLARIKREQRSRSSASYTFGTIEERVVLGTWSGVMKCRVLLLLLPQLNLGLLH